MCYICHHVTVLSLLPYPIPYPYPYPTPTQHLPAVSLEYVFAPRTVHCVGKIHQPKLQEYRLFKGNNWVK